MADGALKTGGLTLTCVTDYEVVRELLGTSDAELHGTTLINLTSGSSAEAREAARWAEQRGARYLDGAVSTLNALGTVTHLGADHGLASLYGVADLAMMWTVLNAWLQGTALLRTAGVDAATYAAFARQMAVGVADRLPGYAEQIDADSFPAEVATLETDARAMAHLIEEGEAAGINTELPKLIKAMADRVIAAGHGGEQYPVLIGEFMQRR